MKTEVKVHPDVECITHLNRYFVLPNSLRAPRDTELSFNPETLIFAQNINTPLITGRQAIRQRLPFQNEK